MLALAYYQLGYMNHHGLGREKSVSLAIHGYNTSLYYDKTAYLA